MLEKLINLLQDPRTHSLANLAHAFRGREVPGAAEQVSKLTARIEELGGEISTLTERVADLEGELSEAEAAACRWENAYRNVKESVEDINKKLIS